MDILDFTPIPKRIQKIRGESWKYTFILGENVPEGLTLNDYQITAIIKSAVGIHATLKVGKGITIPTDGLSFSLVKDWINITTDTDGNAIITPDLEELPIGQLTLQLFITNTANRDVSPIFLYFDVLEEAIDSTEKQDSDTVFVLNFNGEMLFDLAISSFYNLTAEKASEASASAILAGEKATLATNKANEASNSANTASTKANEASNSANTASTKANEASNSANTASTKANEASTSANSANSSKLAAQQAATDAQAIVTIEVIGEDNLLDKDSKFQAGKGIGTNGFIFNDGAFGSVIGMPVIPAVTIVFSGCQDFRGLRWENNAGDMVGLVGSPTLNTPYTVPDNCTRISYQIYSNSSNNANTVQVEVGNVVTSLKPYRPRIYKVAGVIIHNSDKQVYTQIQVDTLLNALNTLVTANSTNILGLQNGLKKINVIEVITQTVAIRANSAYTYLIFTSPEQNEISTWLFAKTEKEIGRIGLMIYKNSANGSFTHGGKVQVVHSRAGVNTVLLNKTIPQSELVQYNTAGIIGSFSNYEKLIDLTTPITMQPGDQLFVSSQFEDKVSPIYDNANALLSSGEWNNGTSCFRKWDAFWPTSQTVYTSIPALPPAQSNYNVVNFYKTTITTETLDLPPLINTIQANISTIQTNVNALNTATALADYEVLAPKHVFFTNSANATDRKESIYLFLQRFIREKKELFFAGFQSILNVTKSEANTGNVVLDVLSVVIMGIGYLTKTLSITRVSTTRDVLASAVINLLYIGDSITENRKKNGFFVGAGALWTMCKEIALKNRADNGGVGYVLNCIGRTFGFNENITYNGATLNVKGNAEGYGGWTAFGWLRHPFRFWLTPSGAWDLLGLSTSNGAYTGTEAQKILIMNTNYGTYTPVVSANSYNLLKAEAEITDLGTWTGSTPQTNAVNAWITGIQNETIVPKNPFFDINKSGTNKFSLTKYLSRYKTLTDDGATRLVVNSTAGNLVTNSYNYDVNTPTHVVLCLGENDRLFSTSYPTIVDNILALADEVKAFDTNMQVGIALTGIPSAMFPERFMNYVGKFYQTHHNAKYDLMKELNSRFSSDITVQKSNRICLIPCYWTGEPNSNSVAKEIGSDLSPFGIVEIGADDYNHPGWGHNRTGAVQLYGWIAYTKS